MPVEQTTWLRPLRVAPAARAVVVCFPPGGDRQGHTQRWRSASRMRISVYAVQYPGRQDRLGDPLVMSLAVLRAEPALAEVVLPPLRRWGADDTVLAMLAALPSDYIQPKKLVQSSFTGPSL